MRRRCGRGAGTAGACRDAGLSAPEPGEAPGPDGGQTGDDQAGDLGVSAQRLCQVAVTEIIGVVLAYCIKSAVENLSKNNRWPDKCSTAGDEEPPGAG